MTAIIYWQDNIAQCSLSTWTLGSESLSLNVYIPLRCAKPPRLSVPLSVKWIVAEN